MLPVEAASMPITSIGTVHCTGIRIPLSSSRTVRHDTPLMTRISCGAAFGKGEAGEVVRARMRVRHTVEDGFVGARGDRHGPAELQPGFLH